MNRTDWQDETPFGELLAWGLLGAASVPMFVAAVAVFVFMIGGLQ